MTRQQKAYVILNSFAFLVCIAMGLAIIYAAYCIYCRTQSFTYTFGFIGLMCAGALILGLKGDADGP